MKILLLLNTFKAHLKSGRRRITGAGKIAGAENIKCNKISKGRT